jgi:hypothetical protein
MIKRELSLLIEDRLFRGKCVILLGARQVGKTYMFRELLRKHDDIPSLYLNCDEPEIKHILTEINTQELKLLVGTNKIIMIDEAQRVTNIGMVLKRITDNFPDVQLLVTGSSSLDLANMLDEPLTGRKLEYQMFPISTKELYDTYGLVKTKQLLNNRLIYGSYPEIITNISDARELLMNLSQSYLYKDILMMEGIRRPELLHRLLVALALQVGSEVSYNEVAQTIGTDSKTVERYVGLLEKCYVIFRLNALNRNMRTEIKKGKKIYFYDNGIRNAILQNFAVPELRNDMGALWENFFISERVKRNSNSLSYAVSYFWRTNEQQEIDYVEERDGAFTAYEMKWNPKKRGTRLPAKFSANYDVAEYKVVTPENYLEALL